MLEIRHLKKAYDTSTPLKDISFTVTPGEVISIIGPSGTGKSTLLRCINGLETPTAGEIIYNGQDILSPAVDRSEIRKHIGMVFQSFNLFPHLTAIQNVMTPQIDLLGRSKQEAYEKAYSLLKQVGLAEQAREKLLAATDKNAVMDELIQNGLIEKLRWKLEEVNGNGRAA